MNCKYCQWCGSSLEFQHGDRYICTGCEKIHYVCPKASAGAFVFSGEGSSKKIHLAVRGKDPQKGKLHVFGGFLDSNEKLEDAFLREFYEETTVSSDKLSDLKYVGNGTMIYVWQGDSYPVSSVYFATKISDSTLMIPSDDVEAIQSFTLEELSPEYFAWPGIYELARKAWDLV